MGGVASTVQSPQTSGGGKGSPIASATQQVTGQQSPKPLDGVESGYFSQAPQPMGKGGVQTNSATSGQPTMGAPNQYSNTVGQWDNTQQQTQQPQFGGGKGKG